MMTFLNDGKRGDCGYNGEGITDTNAVSYSYLFMYSIIPLR